MDLDTLMNVVLIAIFVIITMVIQAVKSMQKKKPGTAPEKASKKSWFPLLQKFKDQLREYAEELERQARQARQQQEPPDETFWNELTEQELEDDEAAAAAADSRPPEPRRPYPEETREKRGKKTEPVTPMPESVGVWKTPSWVREHPDLRQAVVWAEIIGKPVALKKDPPGPGL
jgi:hypothetical protein